MFLCGFAVTSRRNMLKAVRDSVQRGFWGMMGPDFDSAYELGDMIGQGAYATVFRATSKQSRLIVAVKIIERKLLQSSEEDQIRNEGTILSSLNHRNIIRCFGFFEDVHKFYIVMEIVEGGELFDRIVTKTFYSELEARDVVRCLLQALKLCHDNGVVHR